MSQVMMSQVMMLTHQHLGPADLRQSPGTDAGCPGDSDVSTK